MRKGFILRVLCAGGLLVSTFFIQQVVAEDSPRRIEITAERFQYSPSEITVKKGEVIVLVLKSADVAHGLHINGLNIDMKVKAEATTEVQFRPKRTGDFSGHCTTFCGPGHGSMKFKVHVVD